MTAPPGFTVEIDQNPYLPEGATRVDAIISVTSDGGGAAPTADALEIIIVDCSTSMHGDKMRRAQEATKAAIAELRDGVSFVLIAGTAAARQVFPGPGTTATAEGCGGDRRADGNGPAAGARGGGRRDDAGHALHQDGPGPRRGVTGAHVRCRARLGHRRLLRHLRHADRDPLVRQPAAGTPGRAHDVPCVRGAARRPVLRGVRARRRPARAGPGA